MGESEMELKPVKHYSQAQYPSLVEYFKKHEGNPILGAVALAAILAMVGVLCRGCNLPITS